MRTTCCVLSLIILFGSAVVWAQEPPHDPIGENLFPPELLMQHQKAIGLSEEQKNFVKSEILKTQGRFTDLQWQLQSEMETMSALLKQERADEKQVLAQLDNVLNLEREIKKAQIGLIIRIKNKLTPEQQATLQKIKNELQQK